MISSLMEQQGDYWRLHGRSENSLYAKLRWMASEFPGSNMRIGRWMASELPGSNMRSKPNGGDEFIPSDDEEDENKVNDCGDEYEYKVNDCVEVFLRPESPMRNKARPESPMRNMRNKAESVTKRLSDNEEKKSWHTHLVALRPHAHAFLPHAAAPSLVPPQLFFLSELKFPRSTITRNDFFESDIRMRLGP